ncbi:MAG: transcriptional repressor LexA [Thermodesulfobacteriota bacterium]|nr:transcriptional repressor LexA [Thermodesulfobacteriota bacterium]
MREALTPRQRQVLDHFQKQIAENGKPPSLRQAAAALSVSHAAVAQALKLLEDKGYITRQGRYSRKVHVLNPVNQTAGIHRWREIPVVGHITAGLPMHAQQQWEGTLVLDRQVFRGSNLFALRVQGDSMKDAAILDGDLAICEPRQYAENGEIVVALINGEEATVKRFFLHSDHIELRPENPDYTPLQLGFAEVLIQGKVIGIHRDRKGIT